MISTTENETFLIEWIAARNGLPPGAVDPTTPLIEGGLLDSLRVLDLLLAIEERRGAPPDPMALGPGAFRDARTIAARFLEETRHG